MFDFRTKLIMAVTLSTVCISGNLEYRAPLLVYFLVALPFVLLLEKKKYEMCIKGLLAIAISIFLTKNFEEGMGILSLIALIFGSIIRRMLPGIMMGYYAISTTNMSDLVAALKAWHLPDELIIPIAVMFRFFYSLQIDLQFINDGMKMYGLTISNFFKDPIRYFEFKVVPLFMVASKTADDVSISAMSRGLVVGKERSSISNTKLKIIDYLVILGCVVVFGIFVRDKYA